MTGSNRGGGAVHQFVPMLHLGDAVGRHTLAVQSLLRQAGVESEIYVELDDPETVTLTRHAADYAEDAGPGDVLVYQFATATDMAPWLVRRPEPLVVNYHNVTPAEMFGPWDAALGRHQLLTRSQLEQLAPRAVVGVAVSEFNRGDLEVAGFEATAVVPPAGGNTPEPSGGASAGASHAPRRRGARWLTVGRLAPNKAVEDAITALLWYRAHHDPEATLRVIGKPAVAAYAHALVQWSVDLGLNGAVHFEGRVSESELRAAYLDADVLVVTSEHEGFCMPVVEAFGYGVPVLAYREGALPEVMGEGGVLIDDKDPRTIGEAIERLQSDEEHRKAVVEAGSARLPDLGLESAGERLVELLLTVRDRGDLTPMVDRRAPDAEEAVDDEVRGDVEREA